MTPHAVWLASYPKSGNTWVRAVHAALTTGRAVDINQLASGRPPADREVLDDLLGLPSADLDQAEIEVLRPRADEVFGATLTAPTLRKIHDGFFAGGTGEPLVSVAAARGVLYLVRDPRDVAVSLSHHTGRPVEWAAAQLCDPGALLSARHLGITTQVPQRLGTWSEHVRSWTEQTRLPVHLLRYEDALADPAGTFGAALRFAGLAASDDEIAVAVQRAAFDRLAAQEAAEGFRERVRPGARFFRRGEAGGWRDELPTGLADRIVRAHGEVMARFGYLTAGHEPS